MLASSLVYGTGIARRFWISAGLERYLIMKSISERLKERGDTSQQLQQGHLLLESPCPADYSISFKTGTNEAARVLNESGEDRQDASTT